MITSCAPCPHRDGGLHGGLLPTGPCCPDRVRDDLERTSGRTPLRGVTRSPIMSPDAGPRTEIRLGTCARVASTNGQNMAFKGGSHSDLNRMDPCCQCRRSLSPWQRRCRAPKNQEQQGWRYPLTRGPHTDKGPVHIDAAREPERRRAVRGRSATLSGGTAAMPGVVARGQTAGRWHQLAASSGGALLTRRLAGGVGRRTVTTRFADFAGAVLQDSHPQVRPHSERFSPSSQQRRRALALADRSRETRCMRSGRERSLCRACRQPGRTRRCRLARCPRLSGVAPRCRD